MERRQCLSIGGSFGAQRCVPLFSTTSDVVVNFQKDSSSIFVQLTASPEEVDAAFEKGMGELGKAIAQGDGIKGFKKGARLPESVLMPKIKANPQLKAALDKR